MKFNVGAFTLALCVFFETTAYGFHYLIYGNEVKITHSNYWSSSRMDDEFVKVDTFMEVADVKAIPAPNGGPDQPEVQSFTPIGTSDMVDPFTGDFSYNIPLMDVDGYPINIAYNSGVTMDQEASWVGLGWNLNPGVINRAMRGLPDDFDGNQVIEKTMNLKPNWTLGGQLKTATELFGIPPITVGSVSANLLSFTPTLGLNYNNYNGYSASIGGFSTGISVGNLNVGLGYSASSQGGATLSPSLEFGFDGKKGFNNKISLESPINSREGWQQVSMSYSRSKDKADFRPARGEDERRILDRKSSHNASFNFGMSTYTPSISMEMRTGGGSFAVTPGTDFLGLDFGGTVSVNFNSTWLKDTLQYVKPFGYMNLAKGQDDEDAMLDFNRENDGAFTKNTPALPIPNVTYDIFSVSGQGVSGAYRPVRKDVGYIFDRAMKTTSVNGSGALEAGVGGIFKVGVDIGMNYSSQQSGPWNDKTNGVSGELRYTNDDFYFREANELAVDSDPDHFDRIGADLPVHFDVQSPKKIGTDLMATKWSSLGELENVEKSGEDRRNQVLYALSHKEMAEDVGIEELHPQSYYFGHEDALKNQIGQFTVLNTEGSRYVYGIAAFSHFQEDVSFAVGGEDLASGNAYLEGLTSYDANVDNSTNNDKGRDNYYNSVKTPAFAHSYLLTTVLNADYVDADNIKGPSKGDLGGYLTFDYKKIDNYQWRNPVEENKASFDEGFNSNTFDDKGHYIHGEKELWYVKTIQSKNHIAVFYTSPREDGWSVNGKNGGLNDDPNNPLSMQRLDSIQLFSLPDYENSANPIPLKTVHFEYDYSLCQGYSQHSDLDGLNNGSGKLTLKRIYFTYQGSNKGRYTPYVFEYDRNPDDLPNLALDNPDYNMKHIDRWNCYKEGSDNFISIHQSELRPSDFPYVGFDKEKVDQWSSAWSLRSIQLPSGGKIEVDYESDDYAYVQHKRASNMLKIVGIENVEDSGPTFYFDGAEHPLGVNGDENAVLFFELIPGYENVYDYVQPGQLVYFRALVNFGGNNYDFVPCYVEVGSNPGPSIQEINGVKYGRLPLVGAKLKDNGNSKYNPIAVAAIQFARLHLSNQIPPSTGNSINEGSLPSMGDAFAGAFQAFGEFFKGPNKPLWDQGIGRSIVLDHSFVRLQNPNKKKLGGGTRVKEIRMYDSWDLMTGEDEYYYGQTYDYTLDDGTSSGVASYEPQMGGDENTWRKPVFSTEKVLLAPDPRNYQEEPFGEQFFPTPSVGYSQVTISDIKRDSVSRTATGKVVHEFYTAKDFPTIVKRTNVDLERKKLFIPALFFNYMRDRMAASQGFVVETNDMHGKAKRQSVYAEGQDEPITLVEYGYHVESEWIDGASAYHLTNGVKVINRDGSTQGAEIGRTYEAVADFRRSKSNAIAGSINSNVNTIPFIPIPIVLPSGSKEKTEFKSATFTKVIERFGILKTTIAKDLGSVVETNNLAYDAETGAVLLTQTTTNFNDKVYNFTYPAHWYYGEMGQAYKNIGRSAYFLDFVSGSAVVANNNLFVRGDEVYVLYPDDTYELAWITEASSNGITALKKDGTPLDGSVAEMKVLRSGRRNMQNTPVGTIALRTNPLDGLQGNVFEKVLQAGAVEYNDEWRTFCECFLDEENPNVTSNPYVLGTKGTWRPVASYFHLSGRTQSFENGNSNIREDGVFTSFTPFYELNNGVWNIDRENWTYTSSVTEFSPFGQALETVDALERYSSSMFGYNQTLPIAVAANTRYRQLGYDGFEDYDFDNCSDNHFKVAENATLTSDDSHTGRYSLLVEAESPVVFSNTLADECGEYSSCSEELNFECIDQDSYSYLTFNLTELESQGSTIEYEFLSGSQEDFVKVTTDELGNQVLTIICSTQFQDTQPYIFITITLPDGCVQSGYVGIQP